MSFVLDLTRGQARVRQVVFNRGQPRPTVSIGRAAAWSLVADDLEDVHAFVSFDGAALMVRSAEEHNPAWLDGRAVPCAWTPVGRASILALGHARITVTAKEDHVRPGRDDDDEVTGQMELKAKSAVPNTAPTGVTAVTAPPPMTDPDGVDAEQGVTGDEPTGEMTGARAPARGLLPKPRIPPRPSASLAAAAPVSVDPPTEPPLRARASPAPAPAPAPEPMEVPDFDDPTQLRPRDGLVPPAAGRPAAPRPALPMVSRAADVDDEERTHALDVQAMHAAQAAQRGSGAPVPRPARPNIAIAPDLDEATRMLSVAPAGRATVQLGAMPTPPAPKPAPNRSLAANARTDPPRPFTAAAAAAPLFQAATPLPGGAVAGAADDDEEAPPPSGETRVRPMIAQPMRPPNQLVPVRPRAETLIDPFAKTGGGPVALRNLPPIPPANPGTADVTGPSRVDGATAAAAPKKKRSPVASWIAAGVVLTALGGEIYYVYFYHPKPVTSVPQVATTAPTAPAQALTSVPTVALSDADAAAGATVPQNRSVMPLPELPHKGPVDAGAPLDASALDAGVLTIQRAASDAVADGDYGRAVLYYDRLTELDPSTAAYSAAARILRAQMVADAGAHRF